MARGVLGLFHEMDAAIIQYTKKKYNLPIGERTAADGEPLEQATPDEVRDEKAKVLHGGFDAWSGAGFPVTKDVPAAIERVIARCLDANPEARPSIESGVSLGIEPTPQALLEQVDRYVTQGYRRIKLKIGPGRDIAFVAAVRERYPDMPVVVDDNTAYTPADRAMLPEL